MLKEVKEDENKCKNIPFSWVWKIITLKMVILPKVIYKVNAIPSSIFAKTEKATLKFQWTLKESWVANIILYFIFQNNYLKEEQSHKFYTFWFQNLLYSIIMDNKKEIKKKKW